MARPRTGHPWGPAPVGPVRTRRVRRGSSRLVGALHLAAAATYECPSSSAARDPASSTDFRSWTTVIRASQPIPALGPSLRPDPTGGAAHDEPHSWMAGTAGNEPGHGTMTTRPKWRNGRRDGLKHR